jgi:hypothetical protein
MPRVKAVARVALAMRMATPLRRTALICHHMKRPERAQKNMGKGKGKGEGEGV